MKRILALLLIAPLITGCSTASREGAASGAAYGFLGSVAAATVSTVLFGHGDWGDVVEAGVAGAAGGAAVGAAAGAASDRASKQAPAPAKPAAKGKEIDVDAIRAKVGDINFQAGVQWVHCKHDAATKTAQRAFKEAKDDKQKLYALLIQAAAAVESGDEAKAESIYPEMLELDASRNLDKVRADTLSAVLKIQQLRREQGLPPCS